MTAVATSDGSRHVEVERDADGITVRWMCGDTRYFTEDALAEALKHLDSVAPHGVWLTMCDSDEEPYAVKVTGNRIYAGNQAGEQSGWVQWTALREALLEVPPPPPAREQEAYTVTKPEPARRGKRWWRPFLFNFARRPPSTH